MKRFLVLTVPVLLAACSGGPPVPDWKMNAQGALERATDAFMAGRDLVEKNEFAHARDDIAATGKVDLVIRAELIRCAARTAALVFDECAGFEALRSDATAADAAYAAYLAGRAQPSDAALLPEPQRAVLAATSDATAAATVKGIADPLSRLVGAGALFKANRATPELIADAIATASDQGWRRPLLAWLNVQALRAETAGDTDEAARLRRRIALVEGQPAK
ncbi:hypothetical protein GJV26_22450 [Massilia dura]|uniref:Lipoprotein n=1 Tax=Pseudoduganella dura TaxID=321982 RepID=A0A6I3XI83_9BURK|nr:hypothetical protein [Pseudoduganella dura]MUI15206.1 hypothetical protein [Pseudoduganella dura]GGY16457.1 hypothetical protein GCM10007386_52910 [Pseudoduganella dura]